MSKQCDICGVDMSNTEDECMYGHEIDGDDLMGNKVSMRDKIAQLAFQEMGQGGGYLDSYDAADEIIAALPTMVVPLVWSETSASSGGWKVHHTGEGANGASYIVRAAGYGDPIGLLDPELYFTTVFAAKSAAEAHHVTASCAAFGVNA